MATIKDFVGKYVAFKVDPGFNFAGTGSGDAVAAANAKLVDGVLPGYVTQTACTVYDLTGIGSAPSPGRGLPSPGIVETFKPTGRVWSFVFLKYAAGYVTVVPIGAEGVLTGPMSGCWLFTYKKDGKLWLAHIGTADAPDDERTIRAKAAWSKFILRADVTEVRGANPATVVTDDDFVANHPPGRAAQDTSRVGFFDSAGTGYAGLLAPPRTKPGPTAPAGGQLLKVAIGRDMPLAAWAAIPR